MIKIKSVKNRHDLNQFLQIPHTIYRNDPCWIPPLQFDRRQNLSSKNPYFKHAQFKAWLAYRNGKPVGCISAQIDQLHLDRYDDATGFFGSLESEDDPQIFQTLLHTAESWLSANGIRRIRGPFNLSINQECGLLVEGFETPPAVMMGHARSFYGHRIEEQGYRKAKDLLAYHIELPLKFTPMMLAMMKKAGKQVQIHKMRRSDFQDELEVLQDIFEDAWSDNWGFIPYTKSEFEHMGQNLKLLVPDGFVNIATVNGLPAAMMVLIPNLNEIIRDMQGRLLPFNWLKLLWRLKVKHPRSGRVALMGVRKKFQNSRLGAALALLVIEGCEKYALPYGMKEAELSWILEDNKGMRNILDGLGAAAYKRYRIYEKNLPDPTR